MSIAVEALGPSPVHSDIPQNGVQRTTAPYQFQEYGSPTAEQPREELDGMLDAAGTGFRRTRANRWPAAVTMAAGTEEAEAARWRILAVRDEDLTAASTAVDTAREYSDAALAALITAQRELGMAEGRLTTSEEKLEVLQVEFAAARADDESETRSGRQIDPAKVGRLKARIEAQQRTVEGLRRVVGERKRPVDVARRAFEAASEVLAHNKHEHAILAYHHAATSAAADMLAKLRPALERVEDTMASVPFGTRVDAQRQMRQCGERLLCALGRIMPFEAIVAVVGGRPF